MRAETGPIGPFAVDRKAVGRLGLFCEGIGPGVEDSPASFSLVLAQDARKWATSCNWPSEPQDSVFRGST
jgi:hypothetical protein